LMGVALARHLQLQTADVTTAFLHAPAEELLICKPPAEVPRPFEGALWLCVKAINGGRASSMAWTDYFSEVVVHKLGFEQSELDPSLYTHPTRDLHLTAHVDDPLAAGSHQDLQWMWTTLEEHMLLRINPILGEDWQQFLGREYRRVETASHVGLECRTPKDYLQSIFDLCEFNSQSKGCAVPGADSAPTPGHVHEEITPLNKAEHSLFRSLVGKYQYMLEERCDLAYSVKRLSHKLATPTVADLVAAKKVARFLLSSKDKSLFLMMRRRPDVRRNQNHILRQYVDADWAGCRDTRRSTSCGMSFWNDFLLTHSCHTQSCIAQSSAESEYLSMCS